MTENVKRRWTRTLTEELVYLAVMIPFAGAVIWLVT